MKFSIPTVITSMKETGMIPVFYHAESDIAKSVVDAADAGGVRVFEYTNRGGNAYDVFTQLLTHASQYSDLIMGIGTVLDADFFFQAEDGIRDFHVTGVQTCALPI